MSLKEALRPIRAVTLRNVLIDFAISNPHKLTTYGQWMKFLGVDRFELTNILAAIVEIDAMMGTPPVTSIVTRKDKLGATGEGFEIKANSENLNPKGLVGQALARESQAKVWEHYGSQP